MKSINRLPPCGYPITLSAISAMFRLTPHTDYFALIPRQSADQRMKVAWERTGRQMAEAYARVQQRNNAAPSPILRDAQVD